MKWKVIRRLRHKFDMSDVKWQSVINMTNGIIGVSILAMPYCFSKCGLILGTLILAFSAYLTSYSCRILLESSEIKSIQTLEYLAFKTIGHSGKFFVEVCIIFLLFGTMVTYQETLGDSAPVLISRIFGLTMSNTLRSVVMVLTTIVIVLPLSLARKLDRLTGVSAIAIVFYSLFSLYLFVWAIPKLGDGEWYGSVKLWDITGLLKSIPIFSISFSCQTVLFIVYSELPDPSIKKMNKIIDASCILVFVIYFISGVFGYIAFYNFHIHGNIITNMPVTSMSQLMVFGFIICVLFGYPFMVYPCRTSLNTLLFSEVPKDDLELEVKMTDANFKNLTFAIVIITTLTAIMIPNIEFVLTITGSTTGSLICYIIPALIYIKAVGKAPKENLLANVLLWLGIALLFICTLNTIYQSDATHANYIKETLNQQHEDLGQNFEDMNFKRREPPNPVDVNVKLIKEINDEKKILEEQQKLLEILKERLDGDEDLGKKQEKQLENNNNNKPEKETHDEAYVIEAPSVNDTQKLIDKIDMKNKELQNIIEEKIQDIVLEEASKPKLIPTTTTTSIIKIQKQNLSEISNLTAI